MNPDKLLDELVDLGYKLAESRDRQQSEDLLREIVQKAAELKEWIDRSPAPDQTALDDPTRPDDN
jgi:hypothetical protein